MLDRDPSLIDSSDSPLTTIATRNDDAPRAVLEGAAVELVVDTDEEGTDMVSEKDIHMTAKMLDKYYGYNPNPLSNESRELEEIETSLSRVSEDVLSKNFRRVFATIENPCWDRQLSCGEEP